MDRAPLAVTTSDRVSPKVVALAEAAARELGIPFQPRSNASLAELIATRADAWVVFEAATVTLVDGHGSLRFSPGMAHLRIKQLDRGVLEDLLLSIGGIAEGDRVLDCTLGLGADAQVAARRVGPTGAVTALEKSPALYLLVKHGLQRSPRHPQTCPIELVHADAGDFLRALPEGAFDYVYFDPMFEKKRKSSHAFEALRRFADPSPLTPETLADARRVARKAVIVKGARYSTDFKKLGLVPVRPRRSANIVWARVQGSGSVG